MMAASKFSQIKPYLIEIISLSTPMGRLICFLFVTCIVFLSRYHWLANLSLWQRIGWEWAPSIGLTRAYWLVLHGHIGAAWQRNWLIFPVMLIVGILIIKDIRSVVRK